MGGVSAIIRCPDCGIITAELCWIPEHWEAWKRTCHACGHQGLEITAIPAKPGEWTPDPDAEP